MDYDYDHVDNSSDNQENAADEFKKLDKGYVSFYKRVYDNKKRKDGKSPRYKDIKIERFSSGCPGSQIRNAETGVYYTDIVGSDAEHNYYSVVDSTGTYSKGMLTYFYLSKSHYETHMNPSF
jgi:hypothetical protein